MSKKYIVNGEEIKTYPPSPVCAKCGGVCCKRMGCHYSPQDFEDLSFEALKREIEKGKISIDWWENADEPEYYLRARNIGEPIVCGSWGGTCVNLTDSGCSLSWEDRPLGGKSLKPGKNTRRNCTGQYSKEVCKNEWKSHSEVLKELVTFFDREDKATDPIERLLKMLEASVSNEYKNGL